MAHRQRWASQLSKQATVNPTFESCVALSLLCQGYLATFVTKDRIIGMSSLDPAFSFVIKAADQMGWRSFLRSPNGLDPARLRAARHEVAQPQWWLHATPFTTSDVEWVQREVGVWAAELVSRIAAGTPRDAASAQCTIRPGLVALAYLELSHLLGESPDAEKILLPSPTPQLLHDLESRVNAVLRDPARLDALDWKVFEDLIAGLLDQSGWAITPMGYTKDGGIDILGVRRVQPGVPLQMMVQCKRFARNRKVGVDVVRELFSVKWEHSHNIAMLVTTSSFTRGAREKATLWNLSLRDHDDVIAWCEDYRRQLEAGDA